MNSIIDNFYKISGAILLTCFTAWLSWRHFQKTRRVNAADKFRSIVLSELNKLYPIATEWPKHGHDITYILERKFPILSSAVAEYSKFVKDKKGLSQAWDNYRHGDKESATGEQDYFQYTGAYLDDQEPPNPKETFKTNVDRLLEYCNKP